MWDKSKPADFHVGALKEIQEFPKQIKSEIGEFIMALEMGLDVSGYDTKPMKTLAPGAYEYRTYDSNKNYRVFYYMKFEDCILIFHAFTKKTRATTESDKRTAKSRLKQMLDARKWNK